MTIGTTAPGRELAEYHQDITTAYSEVLRRLLAAGARLEPILRAGEERGNSWMLNFLTAEGIDLAPHLGRLGREWLGVAMHARDEASIERLLAAGVDADTLDRRGETLLHAFTYPGFEWQFRRALQAGVDVGRRNSRGETPLEVAVMHGHAPSVARLLKAGAVVTLEIRRRASPKMQAVFEGAEP